MPKRAIASRGAWPGELREIVLGEQKLTFFLPDNARPSAEVVLTIHFHSATWHAIQEHIDRGLAGPLVAFYPGEGSSIYAKNVENAETLGKWFEAVIERLKAKGWPEDAHIAGLNLTSFSAGYGAVRVLVQRPEVFKRLRRVILADSMYGSLRPAPPEKPDQRIPLPEHVLVWKPLAEAAMRGEKTFAVTFSHVPTPTYVSSSEMAAALVESVGGILAPVAAGSLAATSDPEFPLLKRFDRGQFHVWGYGGEDGQAHMTHARHLADIWKALDRVAAP